MLIVITYLSVYLINRKRCKDVINDFHFKKNVILYLISIEILPKLQKMNNTDKIEVKKGYIELICGPMFSGKSTELIRLIKRFKYA